MKTWIREAVFLSLVVSSTAIFGAEKTYLRGLVTYTGSQAVFRVDDSAVACDSRTKIAVRKGAPPCDSCKAIRIGMLVAIDGTMDGRIVRARRVSILPDKKEKGAIVFGTALLDRSASLAKNGEGWSGMILADARKLQLAPTTLLDKNSAALLAETIGPNVFITYTGRPGSNGEILLDRASFEPNGRDEKERELLERWKSVLTPPGYSRGTWGTIAFPNDKFRPLALSSKLIGKARILPDEFTQKRIAEIGQGLVPEFQKSMADDDPSKVHFRFYVVEMPYAMIDTPDGVVLISVEALKRLRNESQVAAILAIAISGVVQEHWQQWEEKADMHRLRTLITIGALPVPLAGPGISGVVSIADGVSVGRYLSLMTQQTARLSLECMLRAGWDIREAPLAVRQLTGKNEQGEVPPSDRLPTVRYMLQEIREKYGDLDYVRLNSGSDSYGELLRHLAVTPPPTSPEL